MKSFHLFVMNQQVQNRDIVPSQDTAKVSDKLYITFNFFSLILISTKNTFSNKRSIPGNRPLTFIIIQRNTKLIIAVRLRLNILPSLSNYQHYIAVVFTISVFQHFVYDLWLIEFCLLFVACSLQIIRLLYFTHTDIYFNNSVIALIFLLGIFNTNSNCFKNKI